jgi:hypothetical protein
MEKGANRPPSPWLPLAPFYSGILVPFYSGVDRTGECLADNDRTLTLTMMVDCRAAFHMERLT